MLEGAVLQQLMEVFGTMEKLHINNIMGSLSVNYPVGVQSENFLEVVRD